jgi:hypothetical protein
MAGGISRDQSDFNFFMNAIFIVRVVPKYLNFAIPSNNSLPASFV